MNIIYFFCNNPIYSKCEGSSGGNPARHI